jgi:aspartate/methionine/tyrosine aminotransferase
MRTAVEKGVQFERFLLDEWLDGAVDKHPRWNLGSVAGPTWSLDELLELASIDDRRTFLKTRVAYSKAAGMDDLRAAIAQRHRVAAEEVLVVTGASEALLLIFFRAAEAGANVVVPAPSFPPTRSIPTAFGLEVRTYKLRRESDWRVDPDEVAKLVDEHTRVLFANSPHNPTGAVLSAEEQRAMLSIASRYGATFVVDEVFQPIYHSAKSESAAAIGATIVSDASKALSLPGLRIGWIIERDPALRAEYLRARMNFTVTDSPISERLALIMLKNAQTVIGATQRTASANLARLENFMEEWSEVLDWVSPAGGTTVFPWIRASGSSRPLCEELLAAGVLVVPGDAFGEDAHIRLGFANEPDIGPALDVVGRVLDGSFVPTL